MQQTQQTTAPVQNSFWAGFHDGVPIGLGYLSVSVTFGMMAVTGGLPVWAAVAISMTNVTSAGQFAGLSLIFGGGTLFETALTQFVINLRYALMSLSLSQKLERRVGLIDRMLFSFMMTDEVFAVASGQKGEVGKRYLFGVMIAPYCGWALGTLCGAVASGFLPPSVRSALSIAIYGMFIAIIVPPSRKNRAVLGDERAVLHEEEHARDRRFEHLAHRTVARVDDEGQLFAAADMRAREFDAAQKARARRRDGNHIRVGDDG